MIAESSLWRLDLKSDNVSWWSWGQIEGKHREGNAHSQFGVLQADKGSLERCESEILQIIGGQEGEKERITLRLSWLWSRLMCLLGPFFPCLRLTTDPSSTDPKPVMFPLKAWTQRRSTCRNLAAMFVCAQALPCGKAIIPDCQILGMHALVIWCYTDHLSPARPNLQDPFQRGQPAMHKLANSHLANTRSWKLCKESGVNLR